ncbi:MAG TPA: restriction endonuclease subunit S, partial [Candidatus Riflebacteria bacterium]|nr:restriction endonuclease subunit S [Candidatus Riflebacteria bacterium]
MKLGDIMVANYGKSLAESERSPGDIPVFSSAGLTGWHNKELVNSEAIIIGRKGNVGSIHYTKGPFYCIDTAYYVLPNAAVNFKFLYYNLIYQKLGCMSDGSPVPGLKRPQLYDREISLFDLPTQHKLATILATYDDLIENNRRRIALLEESARLLYQEWFIKFRFPGHESTRFS